MKFKLRLMTCFIFMAVVLLFSNKAYAEALYLKAEQSESSETAFIKELDATKGNARNQVYAHTLKSGDSSWNGSPDSDQVGLESDVEVHGILNAGGDSNPPVVSKSEDGKGDLLFLPLYLTGGFYDFSTKLIVKNSSSDASTVAWVGVMGFDGNWLLGFYIYLTPANDWTAHLFYDEASDQVRLWSVDGSMQLPTGLGFASPLNPFDHPLFSTDDNFMGYVKIFNVATHDDSPGLTTSQEIHDWFWSYPTSQALMEDQLDKDRNILSARLDLHMGNSNPPFDASDFQSASLDAVALRDFNVSVRLPQAQEFTTFQASVSNDLDSVEAALTIPDFTLPFIMNDNLPFLGTAHFFTFPTKYSHDGPRSKIFQDFGLGYDRQCLQHHVIVKNIEGHRLEKITSPFYKLFCHEMNVIDTEYLNAFFSPSFFDEGWIYYSILDRNNNKFDAPVIPVSLIFEEDGFRFENYSGEGSIQVNILPEEVQEEAKWRIEGASHWIIHSEERHLHEGQYTIEFNNVEGWIKPDNKTVDINRGQTTTVTGIYSLPVEKGNLKVTIDNINAIEAGAQWRIQGTQTWYYSGETVSSLPVGTYTIEFRTVPGWRPQETITVTVRADETVTATGYYVEQATVLPGVLMLLLDEEEE